jgi:hypothetical protein
LPLKKPFRTTMRGKVEEIGAMRNAFNDMRAIQFLLAAARGMGYRRSASGEGITR